jgi:hypothetical protein
MNKIGSSRDLLLQLCGELLSNDCCESGLAIGKLVALIDKDVETKPELDEKLSWKPSVSVPPISVEPRVKYSMVMATEKSRDGWEFDSCMGPPESGDARIKFRRGHEVTIGTVMSVVPEQRAKLIQESIDSQIGGRFVWADGTEYSDAIK